MNCESELAKNWRHINENGKSLPPDWERRISKRYSKLLKVLCFYYKNTETNHTQWLDPTNCLNIYKNRSFSPTSTPTQTPTQTPSPTPTETPSPATSDLATPTETPYVPATPSIATPTETPSPATSDLATPTETPYVPATVTETPSDPATPIPTLATLDPATPSHTETSVETSVERSELTDIPERMNTKSFIQFLKTNGIKYKEEIQKWSNERLKPNSNVLVYLNSFNYKSRVHDLLDIDKDKDKDSIDIDIVNSLLTHLETETGNIINLIKNKTTQKQGKVYIECLDVRNLKVEDIFKIFQELNVTEQVNLQYWDTSNFTTMKNMFSFKTKSQSISTMFDIKETNTTNKITNINVTGLKYWNTSKVTDMNSMFRNNVTFNEKLNWDTSQVVDMSSMFKNASSFNQDVSNWDTSQVVDMSSMFNNATHFNQDVSTWDTRKVFDMRNMFNNAISFNKNIAWETKVIFDDDIITGSNAKLTFKYTLDSTLE
jgi:surface protein